MFLSDWSPVSYLYLQCIREKFKLPQSPPRLQRGDIFFSICNAFLYCGKQELQTHNLIRATARTNTFFFSPKPPPLSGKQ